MSAAQQTTIRTKRSSAVCALSYGPLPQSIPSSPPLETYSIWQDGFILVARYWLCLFSQSLQFSEHFPDARHAIRNVDRKSPFIVRAVDVHVPKTRHEV